MPVDDGVGMSNGGQLDVEFTLVLYSVVVAFAIDNLTFELAVHNAMVLLALAVILGDWVEYRIDVRKVAPTAANYAVAFVLDVVILITWYFLTIVEPAEFEWFLVVGAVFFALQALWDRLLREYRGLELLARAELQLAGAFLVLAAVYHTIDPPATLAIALAAAVFLLRKAPVWYRLVVEAPDAL